MDVECRFRVKQSLQCFWTPLHMQRVFWLRASGLHAVVLPDNAVISADSACCGFISAAHCSQVQLPGLCCSAPHPRSLLACACRQ